MTKVFAWLVGILAVVAIFIWFRPPDLVATLGAIGVSGVAGWIALTLLARFLLAETTVEPMHALGHTLSRSDAFWIGWIRTFGNQVLPLSGLAAYGHALRRKTDISWSELTAMAAPQYVLAVAALGIIGTAAVLVNVHALPAMALLLGALFAGLVIVAVAVARGAGWVLGILPARLSEKLGGTSAALKRMAGKPLLIPRVILWHALVILLRGGRLWILFAAAGVSLDAQQMLLLIAVAEASFLIQLTPGGLGLREGVLLGGAALVGIDVPVAAGVAVIDRLFMIAIIGLMTAPGFAVLSRN